MAIEDLTEVEKKDNLAFIKEQHHWRDEEQKAARAHEILMERTKGETQIKLKELEVKGIALRSRAEKRYETIKGVLVGLIKLPALPFAFMVLAIYAIKREDPPEALDQFLFL